MTIEEYKEENGRLKELVVHLEQVAGQEIAKRQEMQRAYNDMFLKVDISLSQAKTDLKRCMLIAEK